MLFVGNEFVCKINLIWVLQFEMYGDIIWLHGSGLNGGMV